MGGFNARPLVHWPDEAPGLWKPPDKAKFRLAIDTQTKAYVITKLTKLTAELKSDRSLYTVQK